MRLFAAGGWQRRWWFHKDSGRILRGLRPQDDIWDHPQSRTPQPQARRSGCSVGPTSSLPGRLGNAVPAAGWRGRAHPLAGLAVATAGAGKVQSWRIPRGVLGRRCLLSSRRRIARSCGGPGAKAGGGWGFCGPAGEARGLRPCKQRQDVHLIDGSEPGQSRRRRQPSDEPQRLCACLAGATRRPRRLGELLRRVRRPHLPLVPDLGLPEGRGRLAHVPEAGEACARRQGGRDLLCQGHLLGSAHEHCLVALHDLPLRRGAAERPAPGTQRGLSRVQRSGLSGLCAAPQAAVRPQFPSTARLWSAASAARKALRPCLRSCPHACARGHA
mmetsp:Transcript_110573/g.323540  ORF Transcript_110573/g.323540 Transcript_110573/m.323540 type:complete len:329 (-) Transcript_110573:46-1032(-)